MNYLRYKKLYQSDNDGTFWPGYVELPDEDDSSQINKDQEEGTFFSNDIILFKNFQIEIWSKFIYI